MPKYVGTWTISNRDLKDHGKSNTYTVDARNPTEAAELIKDAVGMSLFESKKLHRDSIGVYGVELSRI